MIVNIQNLGYVVQKFDTDEQKFISQDFIGGETEYEDDEGNGIFDADPDFNPADLPKLPVLLKQPSDIGIEHFEWFNVIQVLPEGGYIVCVPNEEPIFDFEGFKTEQEANDHMDELMEDAEDVEYAVVKETRTIITKGIC